MPIRESKKNLDKPVRIDVDFDMPYKATISGFPMTVKSLLDRGSEYSRSSQPSWATILDLPETEGSPVEAARVHQAYELA
ncbi:hypothetical protein IMZ48_44320 [Candidatus Bathyarchaeota archaeon]|nr:hypothetical protein [Candidatus Bathyarchaeota archaeon]